VLLNKEADRALLQYYSLSMIHCQVFQYQLLTCF